MIYLKALDRIIWLTWGRASSSKEYREKAKSVLRRLHSSGVESREDLMREIGLDPSIQEEVDTFNKVMRPLRGKKSSNPLGLCFLSHARVEGRDYYWLSRSPFDATERNLRTSVVSLLKGEDGENPGKARAMEQVLYLCYANASQTARYKPKGRDILSQLINHGGRCSKRNLMGHAALNQSESDDRRFRRTMQYLKGNWDTERKNPLHTENHAFVVSSVQEGSTAYFEVSPGEFRRSMNVVVKSVRAFLGDEPAASLVER